MNCSMSDGVNVVGLEDGAERSGADNAERDKRGAISSDAPTGRLQHTRCKVCPPAMQQRTLLVEKTSPDPGDLDQHSSQPDDESFQVTHALFAFLEVDSPTRNSRTPDELEASLPRTFFLNAVRTEFNRFHDPTRYSKAVCCAGSDANVDRYSKSSLHKVCHIVFHKSASNSRSLWINAQTGEYESINHIGVEMFNRYYTRLLETGDMSILGNVQIPSSSISCATCFNQTIS